MKFKIGIAEVLLSLVLVLCLSIGLVGCKGAGGVQEQKQKQIATACASIAAAVNAIAGATEQGTVSKADAQKALALAKPTASFCQPKPAAHLSPADYAALLSAAADLATMKKEKVP